MNRPNATRIVEPSSDQSVCLEEEWPTRGAWRENAERCPQVLLCRGVSRRGLPALGDLGPRPYVTLIVGVVHGWARAMRSRNNDFSAIAIAERPTPLYAMCGRMPPLESRHTEVRKDEDEQTLEAARHSGARPSDSDRERKCRDRVSLRHTLDHDHLLARPFRKASFRGRGPSSLLASFGPSGAWPMLNAAAASVLTSDRQKPGHTASACAVPELFTTGFVPRLAILRSDARKLAGVQVFRPHDNTYRNVCVPKTRIRLLSSRKPREAHPVRARGKRKPDCPGLLLPR